MNQRKLSSIYLFDFGEHYQNPMYVNIEDKSFPVKLNTVKQSVTELEKNSDVLSTLNPWMAKEQTNDTVSYVPLIDDLNKVLTATGLASNTCFQ
ncbi:unnamed protein product [Rotaria magnacalcarata]|uniref:Uncharacterized protein n=1 Tax=Rotaria magnacalcarata TaxID=392030 RepID=A0A816MKN0_9BILA|nr:unnamed protein product [Rotaria magnacalcarata]CAF5194274.1 unnamed protein product [Rotaria magnacalcarata]